MYLGRYYPDNVGLHEKLEKIYFSMFNNLSVKLLTNQDKIHLAKVRKDIIVSNESILRPFSFTNDILKKNLKILQTLFDLELIITTRNVADIVISKFLDNQHSKPNTITLENFKASLNNGMCYQPFCKSKENLFNKPNFYLKYECVCHGIKNLNLQFYDKEWLQSKLKDFKVMFFELIGQDGKLQKHEVAKFVKLLSLDPSRFQTRVNRRKVQIDQATKEEWAEAVLKKSLQNN
jgi:hypothetical protein